MGSTVAVDIDAHIANVTLNRPEKMNAVSMEMFAELGEVGSHIASDPSVRVVVLSGAGGSIPRFSLRMARASTRR